MTAEVVPAAGDGFTVMDGVALVAGAAVASVHTRAVIPEELFGPGWAVLLGTFAWIGLTAAGPFVYLVRRFVRPEPGQTRVGDRLWAMLGLPWLLTAPLATGPRPGGDLLATGLALGIGATSLVAIVTVWATWVMVPPHAASATFAGSWTNKVGLILAIAWPLQCGVGMVVVG